VADEIGGVASVANLEEGGAGQRVVGLALERFGRLDVVVHNAGIVIWEELEQADRSWERMRKVSIDAPFHITRAAFPVMKSQGYGRFVFTTSGRAMAVERTGRDDDRILLTGCRDGRAKTVHVRLGVHEPQGVRRHEIGVVLDPVAVEERAQPVTGSDPEQGACVSSSRPSSATPPRCPRGWGR
jgi:NAD(P)-dependent dehydrogenase (short-subunit alcohol dehydrogenase family)